MLTDHSLYHFGYNNPISFMDPTGLHNDPARPTGTIGNGGYLEMIDDYDGWAVVIEITQPNLLIPEHTVEFIDHSGSYGGGGSGGGYGGGGGGSHSGAGSGNNDPKGAKNNSPASESPNFLDGANWLVGTTGTVLENTPGSFRFTNGAYNGDVFSPKFYASGWTGGSVARIKTYNLAKIGKAVGNVGFAVGMATDIYGLSTGQTTWGKAGLNTGMSVYGIYVNPITGALYGGLEAFYPGGTLGAMNDYSNAQSAYRQTNNGSVIKPRL